MNSPNAQIADIVRMHHRRTGKNIFCWTLLDRIKLLRTEVWQKSGNDSEMPKLARKPKTEPGGADWEIMVEN